MPTFSAEQREAIMKEAREHLAWKPPPVDVLADLPDVIERRAIWFAPEAEADEPVENYAHADGLPVETVRHFDEVVVGAIAAQVTEALDQHRQFVSELLTGIIAELLARQNETVGALSAEIEQLKADLLIQKSITAQLSADVAATELTIRGGCARAGAALNQ